jgi:hypothetical protein
MSGHTPGPWQVIYSRTGYPYQICATDETLRKMPGRIYDVTRWAAIGLPSSEEGLANARLMAAAPQMLAALERVYAAYASSHSTGQRASCWSDVRSAINAARAKT